MRAVTGPRQRSGARREGLPPDVFQLGPSAGRANVRGLDVRVTLPVCSMKTASGPTVRSGVRHRGTTAGCQPIYGNISSNPKPGANLRPYARKNGLQIP